MAAADQKAEKGECRSPAGFLFSPFLFVLGHQHGDGTTHIQSGSPVKLIWNMVSATTVRVGLLVNSGNILLGTMSHHTHPVDNEKQLLQSPITQLQSLTHI